MKDIARFYKALADEARIQILWLLFNQRELCVCDITEALGITQSKASRHLATLRHAGLVVDRKEGAWSYYSLCPVQSESKREQLEALYKELAGHSGAPQPLRDLHACLARKGRDAKGRNATCVADGSSNVPTRKRNRPGIEGDRP